MSNIRFSQELLFFVYKSSIYNCTGKNPGNPKESYKIWDFAHIGINTQTQTSIIIKLTGIINED